MQLEDGSYSYAPVRADRGPSRWPVLMVHFPTVLAGGRCAQDTAGGAASHLPVSARLRCGRSAGSGMLVLSGNAARDTSHLPGVQRGEVLTVRGVDSSHLVEPVVCVACRAEGHLPGFEEQLRDAAQLCSLQVRQRTPEGHRKGLKDYLSWAQRWVEQPLPASGDELLASSRTACA